MTLAEDTFRTDNLPVAIEKALDDLVDPELLDTVTLANAIRSVLQEHEHRLFTKYLTITTDFAQVDNGMCNVCRNTRTLWCSTLIGIGTALGIDRRGKTA